MKVEVWVIEAKNRRGNVYARITALSEETRKQAMIDLIMGGAYEVSATKTTETI